MDLTGCEPRQGRRSLNAIAALTGQPEKPLCQGIKPNHKGLIFSKGAQASPTMSNTSHLVCCGGFQSRDGQCYIQLVWRCVAGGTWGFVHG